MITMNDTDMCPFRLVPPILMSMLRGASEPLHVLITFLCGTYKMTKTRLLLSCVTAYVVCCSLLYLYVYQKFGEDNDLHNYDQPHQVLDQVRVYTQIYIMNRVGVLFISLHVRI